MPTPLRCPTCSAPLDLPSEHASTLRCPYCGASVLLSERSGQVQAAASHDQHSDAIADVLRHLRAGSKIGAVKAYRDHFGTGLKESKDAVERLEAGQPAGAIRPGAPTVPRKASVGCALLVLMVALLLMYVLGRSGDPPSAAAPPPAQGPATTTAPTPMARQPAAEPTFAQEVMRFGSEGTGAGRFEDARSVAVDGTGRIYVAEYSGGRVQVFDSAGTFLTQWMADPRMPLVDMEADRGGTVYIVQSGLIQRYEGATGRALGPLPRSRQSRYRDVTVALDGSLWAVTESDVVHLSREGAVQRSIDLEEAVDEDAAPARVAVSGTGDLYVLDAWKADVYHLNRDGRFVDRFGGGGFPPAEHVAVDGRGRVFVSDLGHAIQVFNPAGQPLGSIGGVGVVFGLALNDRDELFAAARNDHAVVKFRIPPGERGG
jgi:sugar lactone lactonase YvrE/DNA-directed RNA polymerase subunit RPC12/RpoP